MLQAQQYAAAEGDIVRYIAYNDLAAQNKTKITDTDFFKEISVGTESDYTDTIKQKIVTVKIYKGSDVLPCYKLEVPRLSADVSDAKGVPIGTVITWASNNPPTENGTWLECNGQSCAAYPELVRVLGKNTVPDYRGMFLRGLGSQNYSQNNGSEVGTTFTTYASGSLGVIQGDAIRNIKGTIGEVLHGYTGDMSDGAFYGSAYFYGRTYPEGKYNSAFTKIDVSRVVPTANEIRPVNIAVRYFIRAA